MITKEKLIIYTKYGGDPDSWARSTLANKSAKISEEDWALIGNLIQDLTIISNNSAAESFAKSVESRINETCDSEETKRYLKSLI